MNKSWETKNETILFERTKNIPFLLLKIKIKIYYIFKMKNLFNLLYFIIKIPYNE
jgi:hypothetical protein